MGRKRTRRAQRGGGDGAYGFTGVDSMSAAGTPLDTRGASYTQCGWDARVAPDVSAYKTVQFGGRSRRRLTRAKRFRHQRGGGCGCMAAPPMQSGGGSGNGGYQTYVGDNSLIKMPIYNAAPCPPAPRETQIGGAAVDDIGIVSYKSGYGFGPASVYSTASAHYLDKLPYDRTVLTGGSRKHRKGRKGRSHRKGSRKH